MRLIDFFDRGVALDPARPFLIDAEATRSFAEVQAQSHRIANGLIAGGFPEGTKAAVYSPNLGRAFECILGIARAGGVWVPVNARNGVDENVHILGRFDVEVLFWHGQFEEKMAAFRERCPGIRRFLRIDGDGPDSVAALVDGQPDHTPIRASALDAVTAIFPTGGTTGLPKGAVWTNLTWMAMIANLNAALPSDVPPVHLVVAPMTHAAGGLAMMLMASGATNVILPAFDPLAVMEAIGRYRVTHLFLPPTAIYMLLAHPAVRSHDYASLRYLIYAAAPMSVEKLKEAMDVFGPVMAQSFGQAEAPMFCTILPPRDHLVIGDPALEKRLASCGRPSLLTPVAIMDEDGTLLPDGQVGEIVVRGALVMQGYYKNPQATADASAHGWHHTGDLGYRDADGFVYIVDRKRDMIISGGFNIYPSEIEQVIWSHPAVEDCAVVGAPDDKWGEAVTACVQLKPGAAATAEEIATLCRERLGGVKTPKQVTFWDPLPRSPVGKVLKRSIRDHYWQGRARRV